MGRWFVGAVDPHSAGETFGAVPVSGTGDAKDLGERRPGVGGVRPPCLSGERDGQAGHLGGGEVDGREGRVGVHELIDV
jgi:hypothetical protein